MVPQTMLCKGIGHHTTAGGSNSRLLGTEVAPKLTIPCVAVCLEGCHDGYMRLMALTVKAAQQAEHVCLQDAAG